MNHHERRILTATCWAHFLSHCNMLVFPAVALPLAGHFDRSLSDTLAMGLWMYVCFGLSALPWGLLADRVGVRPLLLLFQGGSMLCAGAAALLIDSPAGLTWALTFLGLFSGIYHPVGLGLISKQIRRTGMGLAWNGMFGNLGIAAAPLLAGLATRLWGPGAAFVLLAVLNAAGLALVPAGITTASQTEAPHDRGRFQTRPFLFLLGAMMLGGIVYRGATVTMPAYCELRMAAIAARLQLASAGTLTPHLVATAMASLIFLAGMAGQYAGGRVADKFDLRTSYLLFHALTIPVGWSLAILTNSTLAGAAGLYAFFLLGVQPLENTLVARFSPPSFRHAAYGLKFILTFGVGAGAVELVGMVERARGITAVFPALSVVSLVLVGCILGLIAVSRRQTLVR